MEAALRPALPDAARGVLIGFLAYATFATGDAFIKAAGAETGVFTIAFFIAVFNAPVMYFARPKGERWRDFWKMQSPVLLNLRGLCAVLAGCFGIYAFTHLPLAEAYALIFLMPVFVALLSALLLGEGIDWRRGLAIALGLAGVLVAVRPGFRELELGHLAAACTAVAGAFTVIILRRIAGREKRTSLLGVLFFWGVIANGALFLTDPVLPKLETLPLLALAGTASACGQLCLIAASRAAPASRIAPAQYSQIVWAVLFGALFFSEFPDALTLAGLALVVASGLVTVLGGLPARRPA